MYLITSIKKISTIFIYLITLSILIACSSSDDSNDANTQDQNGTNNNGLSPLDDEPIQVLIKSASWNKASQLLSVVGTFSSPNSSPNNENLPDAIIITDIDIPTAVLATVPINANQNEITWSTEISDLTVIPCKIKSAAGDATDIFTVTNTTGMCGNMNNPPVNTNTPPVAIISPSTNQAITPGTRISFSGNSSSDPEGNIPLTYAWTFNGGTPATSTIVNPVVQFDTTGSFSASLTVTDSRGSASTPTSITIDVNAVAANQSPNAVIISMPTANAGTITINSGSSVNFSGVASSDPEGDVPLTYAWTFAGGTPANATTVTPGNVLFNAAGTYVTSLLVIDRNGNMDPTPAQVTVVVTDVVSSLPEFKFLPLLIDEDGNPNDGFATYTLNVEENVNVNVVTPSGNWTTPMMRYNGLQLPPVISAKRGTQMTFNVNNNLPEYTTVHWHGFKIPAVQDGGPNFPIAAAESRIYNFTLVQAAGPLWFHPHAHGTTATQVYRGLAGAFIITDDITDNLKSTKQIPTGEQDIALLIQDRRFEADNGTGVRPLIYQNQGPAAMIGMLGDHILVNGVELPSLKVDARQYRFRIFNGSNARTYDIALADSATFKVVGTDGGLLNTPVQTDHIMLSAGERAEIVVDFNNYAVGDNVTLVSRAFNAGCMMGMMGGCMTGGGALANGAAFDVMRFEIATQAADDVVLYTALPTNADINTRLTAADATATRRFVMSMGPGMQFLINNKSFDMDRVDEIVASGATEIWDISNMSPMPHPFHAHAIQWQILDRNGIPASGVDLGWKDTVLVKPNESVRFIGRFDPVVNKGVYMYHCHILEHEDAGMMGTFEVL